VTSKDLADVASQRAIHGLSEVRGVSSALVGGAAKERLRMHHSRVFVVTTIHYTTQVPVDSQGLLRNVPSLPCRLI